MHPIKRRNGNQYLHRESESYRRKVLRKMQAYHGFEQAGIIAQGMLQFLAMTKETLVWAHFDSWSSTIRPGVLPSEMIVSESLKNTLPEFLQRGAIAPTWRKFLHEKIDFERPDGSRFAA